MLDELDLADVLAVDVDVDDDTVFDGLCAVEVCDASAFEELAVWSFASSSFSEAGVPSSWIVMDPVGGFQSGGHLIDPGGYMPGLR